MELDARQGYYYGEKSRRAERYLFVNPPIIDRPEFKSHSLFDPGPVGLLRVARYLFNQGHLVRLFDFRPRFSDGELWKEVPLAPDYRRSLFYYGRSLESMAAELQDITPPDHIYVGSCMTYNCATFPALLGVLRGLFPKARIVLGGILARLLTKEMRALDFDEVHVGPYGDGEADTCPPLYSLMTEPPRRAVLRLTRGCPRICSYCAVPSLEGRRVENKGFARLVEQFEVLYGEGFRIFSFWDANVLHAPKELAELLRYVKDRSGVLIDLHYGLEFAHLKDEVLELFNHPRVERVLMIPIESAIPELFKERFHKDEDHLEQIDACIGQLRGLKYRLGAYVLMGMPGQTVEDVMTTVTHVHRRGCFISMMPFTAIPRTAEYKEHKHLIAGKPIGETNPHLYPFAPEDDRETLGEMFDTFHGAFPSSDRGPVLHYLWENRRRELGTASLVERRYVELMATG